MKKISTRLLLLLLTFSILPVHAQLNKANRAFDQYDYARAIPIYKQVVEQKNAGAAEATSRIADCYRMIRDYSLARIWYAKAVRLPDSDPSSHYFYGQALRGIGKYKEAKEQFLLYAKKKPNDPRGKIFARYCDEIEDLARLRPEYVIKNADSLNSEYSDFSPVMFKNGMLFCSDRRPEFKNSLHYNWTGDYYLDVYYADLDIREGEFPFTSNIETFLRNLNEKYHDGPVTFTDDYNKMYFTRVEHHNGIVDSSRYFTNRLQIFSSTWDGKKWSKTEKFPYNDEGYSVGHPTLSSNGKQLIFVSDIPGGKGGTDLYISNWDDEEETWLPPKNMGATLNTLENEMFPWLDHDSVLYFASAGHMGFGGLDIFKSRLIDGSWSEPINLRQPINSTADDFAFEYCSDHESGFFSSNRFGGQGKDDIYSFRDHHLPDSVLLSGYVKDKASNEPIENATVYVLNKQAEKVFVIKTDADGLYQTIVKRDINYVIKATKPDYYADCLRFTLPDDYEALTIEPDRDLLLGQYRVDEIFRLENIYYDFDKWNIRPDAAIELDKVIGFLQENIKIEIELGSHTDCRGSDAYNQVLSEKRAVSAVNYLIEHGINKDRVTAKGYGETILKNHCDDGVQCTEEEHQLNRRTEIKITGIIKDTGDEIQCDSEKYHSGEMVLEAQLPCNFFTSCEISAPKEK